MGKKIGIIAMTILGVLCVAIDIWAIVVYKFSSEKRVSSTYEMGFMQTADGSDKKTFLEINYFNNKNNNGLEMFEIRYNYFLDEKRESFVSIVSQYIADSKDDKINWSYNDYYKKYKIVKKERYGFLKAGLRYYYNVFFETTLKNGSSYHEYFTSSEDFAISTGLNRITDDRMFKVSFDIDGLPVMYEIGFKKDIPIESAYLETVTLKSPFSEDINNRYAYIDHNFFAYYLYSMCQGSTITTGSYDILELGDFFTYWEDSDKDLVYKEVDSANHAKITNEINNYYCVKINIHEDGARYASDSLAKIISDDPRFNFAGDYVYDDYVYCKNVINVGLADFDVKELEDGTYTLVLKDIFVDYYKPYSRGIVLYVDVNLDDIENADKFSGFKKESFRGFETYKIYTHQTKGVA